MSYSLNDDATPLYPHNNLQPPSTLVQNPQLMDVDVWGCNTDLRLYDDPWKIKKVLTATDVDPHQSRLLLPDSLLYLVLAILTKHEQSELLDSGKGIEIKFCDVDTDPMSLHSLILKKCPSSGSFVLNKNWNSDFLKRRKLREGDNIGFQWDKFNHRFNFSVLSRRHPM